MNEKANEVLAQLMQRALDGVDAAVDFSQQQIPDVVNQLLVWHAVESAVFFGIGVLMVTMVALPIRLLKHIGNLEYDSERTRFGTYLMGYGIGGATYVTMSVSMIFANLDWLKIWLAPKLYLLEYGAHLIK